MLNALSLCLGQPATSRDSSSGIFASPQCCALRASIELLTPLTWVAGDPEMWALLPATPQLQLIANHLASRQMPYRAPANERRSARERHGQIDIMPDVRRYDLS
jgi:hypothetical protein